MYLFLYTIPFTFAFCCCIFQFYSITNFRSYNNSFKAELLSNRFVYAIRQTLLFHNWAMQYVCFSRIKYIVYNTYSFVSYANVAHLFTALLMEAHSGKHFVYRIFSTITHLISFRHEKCFPSSDRKE